MHPKHAFAIYSSISLSPPFLFYHHAIHARTDHCACLDGLLWPIRWWAAFSRRTSIAAPANTPCLAPITTLRNTTTRLLLDESPPPSNYCFSCILLKSSGLFVRVRLLPLVSRPFFDRFFLLFFSSPFLSRFRMAASSPTASGTSSSCSVY